MGPGCPRCPRARVSIAGRRRELAETHGQPAGDGHGRAKPRWVKDMGSERHPRPAATVLSSPPAGLLLSNRAPSWLCAAAFALTARPVHLAVCCQAPSPSSALRKFRVAAPTRDLCAAITHGNARRRAAHPSPVAHHPSPAPCYAALTAPRASHRPPLAL